MANTAVPRMGEFMRCGVLSKKEKIPFNILFGSVISERIFDILVLLIFVIFKLKEKIIRIPFYQKIKQFLLGLMVGIKTIMKLRQKWLFMLYTTIIWLFYAIMFYLPVLMLEETSHLTFINGVTILAIGSLGIVAPVPEGGIPFHCKGIIVRII